LDNKVDATKFDVLESMVKVLDTKMSDGYDNVVKSVEKSAQDVNAVIEQTKLEASTMKGCVNAAVRVQTREEKEEEEDKERRKCNVIIHGLKEPTATEAEDRREEDFALAEELLHKLSCDDVSVNHIARLGAPSTDSDSKVRPVKLELASADSRNKVLRNAKNLRRERDASWKNIFLHRDLTPREREARRQLVQELKDRKTAGEANLIIVSGKIVSKRPYTY